MRNENNIFMNKPSNGLLKFRKKPIVIDAFRPGIDEMPVWLLNHPGFKLWTCLEHAYIETLEGKMHITKGDWIIKGVKGEIYPCKPDVFEETYEVVTDED